SGLLDRAVELGLLVVGAKGRVDGDDLAGAGGGRQQLLKGREDLPRHPVRARRIGAPGGVGGDQVGRIVGAGREAARRVHPGQPLGPGRRRRRGGRRGQGHGRRRGPGRRRRRGGGGLRGGAAADQGQRQQRA